MRVGTVRLNPIRHSPFAPMSDRVRFFTHEPAPSISPLGIGPEARVVLVGADDAHDLDLLPPGAVAFVPDVVPGMLGRARGPAQPPPRE